MNIKKMNIHLFKTREGSYIYDVGTNGILCVSDAIYTYIQQIRTNERQADDQHLNKEIDAIRQENYLSEKRIKNIEHPATKQLPSLLKTRLNSITLQVTQQCNLRCKYCTYSGSYHNRIHADKNMSKELAFKGVDYIVEQAAMSPSIFIGFYGGEPLLRFDLIRDVVEYTKQKIGGKVLKFHMTTNGTLLTEDIIRFLVDNDFKLMISLDGPEQVHDANRVFASSENGSFKTIVKHLKKVEENHKAFYQNNVSYNCVMDGQQDYQLIHNFFNEDNKTKEWRVNSTLVSQRYAKDEEAYDPRFIEEYNYQRFLALLASIKRIDPKHVSKLMKTELRDLKDKYYRRKVMKGIRETDHPGGPCIPGVRKLFMDVKGDFYP